MTKKKLLGSFCVITIAALVLFFSGISFAQDQGAPSQGSTPPAGAASGGAPGGGGPAWMSAAGDEMPKAFIKAEDKNGDRKVSKDEFGGPDTLFDQWDKNKDGFIELSEAPTPEMMQGMGGQGGTPGDAPGGSEGGAPAVAAGGSPGGTPPEGGGMPAGGFVANSPHVGDGPTGQAFIDTMDTNKDGKIDHDEWERNKVNTVYKNKRWPNYNKNMDQYITLDEAPQEGVNWEAAPDK